MNASLGQNSKFKLALCLRNYWLMQARNAACQQRGYFLSALFCRHSVRWGLVHIHYWYRFLSVQLD